MSSTQLAPASPSARALAFLRIAIGLLFLIFAEYKLADLHFIKVGMAVYIQQFLDGQSYPFIRPLLERLILPHAVFFGAFTAAGELLIGLSLVTGILVRAASVGGALMMALFLFSSNYPGSHAAFWIYFGSSLSHFPLLLCFIAFLIAPPNHVWSLRLKS